MCWRFVNFHGPTAIRDAFRTVGDIPTIAPSWNVAPTQAAMVVRRHRETGERRSSLLRWGLIPHFTKNIRTARKPINAQSETAGRSSVFRDALTSRRCLVPANAFYEWRGHQLGTQPYAIARRDRAPMALAGLWDIWREPDGEMLRTFTILTTSANATVQVLHERMPVILEETDWPVWLGEVEGNPFELMRPAGDYMLKLWPVSRAVNSIRSNGAHLLERFDDPAVPPPNEAAAGANPA